MTLDAARGALVAERRRIRDEQEAFREFERRLADLQPSRPHPQSEAGATRYRHAAATDVGLARLREAYEETVMSVDHYEEEYGEEFHENVRVELGEEYAELLRAESRLTPELKQGLRAAVADARQRRARFADILDEEAAMLDRAEALDEEVASLTDCPGCLPFDQLQERAEQLDRTESRTETLLCERQRLLHRWQPDTGPNSSPMLLNDHLYDDIEHTYPVLHALTALLEEVRDARDEIAERVSEYREK